jgi:hypothetical protein
MQTQFGIRFLIDGTGKIHMENIPGVCKKTKAKVRGTLNHVFQENKPLLLSVLNRYSLFSDEQE